MPKYRVTAGGLARVTRDDRNRETERKHYSRGDVFESDADNAETQRYLRLGAIEEVDEEISAGNKSADDRGLVLDSDPRRVSKTGVSQTNDPIPGDEDETTMEVA